MTPAGALPSLVGKEARVLLVPWLACAAAMVAATTLLDDFASLGLFAYMVGAPALGALAVGHEYAWRTLGLLLSLPVPRERLYLSKLAALAAMLAALVALEYFVFPLRLPGLARYAHMWILLPALGGLCVAPWLTMATRNPMAGTVFTLAIPVLLQVIAGTAWQISGRPARWDPFQPTFLWRGMLVICAFGAVAGWRLFMRLEAADGSDAAVMLPRWVGRRPGAAVVPRTPRHPLWLLVAKELRLQQLATALAALYAIGWVAGFWWLGPAGFRGAVGGLTVFYAVLLGIVIGSFASAEERQLGTLEWQMLLPVSTATQWFVKSGIVFGLVLLMALGLPAALERLARIWLDAGPSFTGRPTLLQLAHVVLLATTVSLYVSTLCSSGMLALIVSVGATFGSLAAGGLLLNRLAWLMRTHIPRLFPGLASADRSLGGAAPGLAPDALGLLLLVGFVALCSRLALANHRVADRPVRRVAFHLLTLALYAVAWAVIFGVAAAVLGVRR